MASASLGDQTLGALTAIAWSGIATTIIAFAIKFTIGWRIDEEDEVNDGIDLAQHGESAYDFASLGGGVHGIIPSPGAAASQSTAESRGVNA